MKVKVKKRPNLIRPMPIKKGFPTAEEIGDEVEYMFNVLLGRVDPPMRVGVTTLMEIADAYYARAAELTYMIHREERRGNIKRGDELYKVRTGELADFMEACKRAVETGSRRLSYEQLKFNQHDRGLSSEGWSL